MTLNYRQATISNIADALTELKTEAEANGATINYFDTQFIGAYGGLHFTLPGTTNSICLEYKNHVPNMDYYAAGLCQGYNSGDGNDISDQPGYMTTADDYFLWHPKTPETATLHIFSRSAPFAVYMAVQYSSGEVCIVMICNLENTGGDSRVYTLKTSNNYDFTNSDRLFDYYSTQLLAKFPGGNNGSGINGSWVGGQYSDGMYRCYTDTAYHRRPFHFWDPYKMHDHIESAPRIEPGVDSHMCPMPIICNKREGSTALIGYVPDAKITNFADRTWAEQLTYGTRRFVVFPTDQRPWRFTTDPGVAFQIAGG